MCPSARTLVTASLIFLATCAAARSAPPERTQGVVRGEVTDLTGGVLPGVTVVSTAVDGTLATTVTNAEGVYVFPPQPAGPAKLSFQLDGFATVAVGVSVRPGADLFIVERMGPAPVAETVNVYARAPVVVPPPPPPPLPPVVIPVPPHERESVCGPAKPDGLSVSFGTIESGRYAGSRGLYATGDELFIDGGTLTGLVVGQNLAVRRHYRVAGASGEVLTGEHTSGLVQIVEADERSAVAVVVYACDELMSGDFLAAFDPFPSRLVHADAGYSGAATVLFGDVGQVVGVPGRLLVVDRGADAGIEVGQRLALFRRKENPSARQDTIGSAVVVAVRADSATIRVDRATDIIAFGDWAVPQHQTPAAPPRAARGARLLRR